MGKSVIVIGAGVAGIAAAAKLTENGFDDVKILEASDRIGGRIHSVLFGSNGEKIDLGAQWVSAENDVYDLLKNHFQFGDTNLSQERKTFLTTSDEELDQEKCQQLVSLGDQIWELSEEMENSEETFGEFFIRKYHEALAISEFKNTEERIVKQMLQHHEREFNAQYSSTTWHQVKAKFFPVGDPGSETMTWKTSGYSVLLDYITVRIK